MKKTFTLRSLAIFSFAIFCFPFMRTCSDESIRFSVKEKVEEMKSITYENNDFLYDENNRIAIEEKKEIYTFNFYILSLISLDDFKLGNFTDSSFYGFFGFTCILISSILILFFSFKNNFKIIYLLSITDILILFISTLILWLNETIESFNQIKIGYYLLVLNSIALIFLSKRILTEKENPAKTSNL